MAVDKDLLPRSKEAQAKKVKEILSANPGMSIATACQQEGITPGTYYRYFKGNKLRAGTRAKKIGNAARKPVNWRKIQGNAGGSLSVRKPTAGFDKLIPSGYTTMVVPTSVAIAFLEHQK